MQKKEDSRAESTEDTERRNRSHKGTKAQRKEKIFMRQTLYWEGKKLILNNNSFYFQ